MSDPHFNLTVIDALVSHRSPVFTAFFGWAADFGGFYVYTMIVMLIYVAWNKHFAIRLVVLLVFAATLNCVLKLIVKNPRPFVREGTYSGKWAVSAEDAKYLATDYSTPSGHAMSASAFYSYLFTFTTNRYVRVLAVLSPLLIGMSRPYLGVHYVEDVLLGWGIGILCTLLFVKYFEAVDARWNRLSFSSQLGITALASVALFFLAYALNGNDPGQKATEIFSYAGFLIGIVFAHRLELRIVRFDPRSSSLVAKILRFLFTCALLLFTEAVLGEVFAYIAGSYIPLRFLLSIVRFTVAGFVCIFLAPFLFTKMGLAESTPVGAV